MHFKSKKNMLMKPEELDANEQVDAYLHFIHLKSVALDGVCLIRLLG